MRWLRLYLRSRRVPLALAWAAAPAALVWALWLTFAQSRSVDPRLVSLTVMLAVVAFSHTLAGADDALDRTASFSWPLRRAAHLLAVATAVAVLLLLSTPTGARYAPLGLVLRDLAGLLGLTALGAALLGAARSWIAPLTWALVTVLPWIGPSTRVPAQVAGWLIQPVDTPAATACAAVLAATGLAAYTLRGCPAHPATETAPGP